MRKDFDSYDYGRAVYNYSDLLLWLEKSCGGDNQFTYISWALCMPWKHLLLDKGQTLLTNVEKA